ncbi:PDZ domain-containing protein [Pseudonocardia sp. DSM 110487]|uniref:S41 family peptidase n=1 Tax=Pseudonocardia sp. DSM 110487 TaxID=2865833 RepID=UPI001C695BCE|nr:S41 family peptidase [Pseudonocardia sp. DSM 110487]QYN36600.1 PDZ domain-containing protein [Pseudonocardia sp. DSM 110487]
MSPSYLRFPHLRGDTLVFTAEDDVWTAPLSGGRAYRLTADDVPVAHPRLSPDGTRVSWTSWKNGAPEVYVSDVDGGGVRRLTYWGDPRAESLGWTPDGEVLALSGTGQASSRRTWAYAIPAAGGTPRRLPYGPVSEVALAADGPTVVISTLMVREPAWWKRYRGGTMGKLWWDRTGSGEFERLAADVDGQLSSPMIVGSRIVFLSDHEGWGNLYSLGADGTGLRRHTDHGAPGAPAFYARHASTDGQRVVYESAGELWILDSLDAEPRRLDVRLGGPRTNREPYRVSTARELTRAAPDKTGRTSITLVRGTVHRLTHRDGPARTLLAEPGVRARLARPLGTDRAVWVDDADGEDAICVAPLDERAEGVEPPRRFGAGEVGRVLELAPAPDASAVALATHDGRLLVLDVAAGTLRQLAQGADRELADLAWSPDSAWLAYSDPAEAGFSRIMMARLADDTLVAVTEPRFADTDPVFTSDGKYLAFLSRRSFDPIYDEHAFDLTFPASWRPFLVPLAARTPSPFGASPDGRPVSPGEEAPTDLRAPAADDPSAETPEEPKDEKKKDDDGPPEVVVDVEGLTARVVPMPVPAARYSGMQAGKDCLLWYRIPVSGVLGDALADTDDRAERPVLERFDLVRRKLDVIADPVSAFAVSGDGTRLVVRDGRTLRVLRTDRSGSDTPSSGDADEFEIDTSRIDVTVDPTAEWRQMFDEAGRLMRDHFWVADMAGVDWDAELARYRPLVDAVGSHDDLVDLLWEVHGELGTSHAYVQAGKAGDSGGRPGLLGADLEPAADGEGWRVVRVLPPETSAPAARSPLSGPGVDVREGDVILEVGGRPVDPGYGPAPLLVSGADKLVELTVRSGPDRPDADAVRRVVVKPLGSEAALRYQDWVAGRRAFVADRSEGRLGYLHVPDMGAQGWAQLHRDLTRETSRDGLILDVRGNGGGHTSQLVIEKLARKVIGWDAPRHRQATTYPEDAPRGPVVALADELAGSDGDIVTAAIKRLGIGPVVGVRTWGGVIGIDSRYSLVDGTGVTQPRYATWFDDSGWSIENYGVDPDIEVVMRPQDWVAGRDPQLERAVDIALEALSERPAVRPPDPATRPSRRRPELPPRPVP